MRAVQVFAAGTPHWCDWVSISIDKPCQAIVDTLAYPSKLSVEPSIADYCEVLALPYTTRPVNQIVTSSGSVLDPYAFGYRRNMHSWQTETIPYAAMRNDDVHEETTLVFRWQASEAYFSRSCILLPIYHITPCSSQVHATPCPPPSLSEHVDTSSPPSMSCAGLFYNSSHANPFQSSICPNSAALGAVL